MICRVNFVLDSLKIDAKCVDYRQSKHFVSFDLKLGPNGRIAKVEKMVREIGLRLGTKTAPGIKVISDQGILRLDAIFRKADLIRLNSISCPIPEQASIPVVFGESSEGNPVWLDLANAPHLLIAGASGSGKSTLLHTIIANLLKNPNNSLYLGDPKQVEFEQYRKDLYTSTIQRVFSTYEEAVDSLQALCDIMEQRYEIMALMNVKDSNAQKIICVIDELADLVVQDKNKKLEKLLIQLVQKSRAAGIHMILATQRPSANILSGLIRANVPTRIACRVATQTESRIIIDGSGAENLMGMGDAILLHHDEMTRFQVAAA